MDPSQTPLTSIPLPSWDRRTNANPRIITVIPSFSQEIDLWFMCVFHAKKSIPFSPDPRTSRQTHEPRLFSPWKFHCLFISFLYIEEFSCNHYPVQYGPSLPSYVSVEWVGVLLLVRIFRRLDSLFAPNLRVLRESSMFLPLPRRVSAISRDYIFKNYEEIKMLNPILPFLVREAEGTKACVIGRYGTSSPGSLLILRSP